MVRGRTITPRGGRSIGPSAGSVPPYPGPVHDLVIRNGTVVDGSGAPPTVADVALDGDRIAAVGGEVSAGRREVDAGWPRRHPGLG